MELTDDDIIYAGLAVLAYIHAGIITISCADCDDRQKELYACTENADQPIFEEDDMEFYTCPLKFLTRQVYEFWDEYSYYQMFQGSAPKYGDHSKRFFDMARYYKNKYESHAYKTNKSSDKQTDQSLKDLKKNFRKK